MGIHVESLKPKAKNVTAIASLMITPEITVQAKADGEFCLLTYEGESAYTVNRWNTRRTDFPALTEFVEAMKKTNMESAELLCELYCVDEGGRMSMLPNFIHNIKGGDAEKVRIGVFQLLTVNGKPVNQSYKWGIQEVEGWLKGCSRAGVLPYICPKSIQEVEAFWKEMVEAKGFEGLMVRYNGETFKVKQRATVDCAIIGINKKHRFRYEEVTSLKLALLDSNGIFIELGDVASGIDGQLRKALWKLMDFKVQEDNETIWIKPMVIAEVEYTQTFESDMRKIRFEDNKIFLLGYQKAHSLRHPRLLGFRKDKRVCYEDIRIEQI